MRIAVQEKVEEAVKTNFAKTVKVNHEDERHSLQCEIRHLVCFLQCTDTKLTGPAEYDIAVNDIKSNLAHFLTKLK